MAVGDVVNGFGAVAGATLNFQPAAGVEVMISSAGANGNQIRLFNGAADSYNSVGVTGQDGTSGNLKIFITNTNYLQVVPTGIFASFTGIQIN